MQPLGDVKSSLQNPPPKRELTMIVVRIACRSVASCQARRLAAYRLRALCRSAQGSAVSTSCLILATDCATSFSRVLGLSWWGALQQPIQTRHARISANQIVYLCVRRPRPYCTDRDFQITRQM